MRARAQVLQRGTLSDRSEIGTHSPRRTQAIAVASDSLGRTKNKSKGVHHENQRFFSALALVIAVTVGVGAPANAGEHGWNSYSTHWHNSIALKHGQKYVGPNNHEAFTFRLGWANLGIQARYQAYGTWYYSSVVEGSDGVGVSMIDIDQHHAWW